MDIRLTGRLPVTATPPLAGCAYHTILQPQAAVINRYRETALRILDPDVRVIAIHKRTGDRSMHLLETPSIDWKEGTWSCAEQRKSA